MAIPPHLDQAGYKPYKLAILLLSYLPTVLQYTNSRTLHRKSRKSNMGVFRSTSSPSALSPSHSSKTRPTRPTRSYRILKSLVAKRKLFKKRNAVSLALVAAEWALPKASAYLTSANSTPLIDPCALLTTEAAAICPLTGNRTTTCTNLILEMKAIDYIGLGRRLLKPANAAVCSLGPCAACICAHFALQFPNGIPDADELNESELEGTLVKWVTFSCLQNWVLLPEPREKLFKWLTRVFGGAAAKQIEALLLKLTLKVGSLVALLFKKVRRMRGGGVPAGENNVPAGEVGVPVEGNGVRVEGDDVPAGENNVPAGEVGVPVEGNGVRAEGDDVPAASNPNEDIEMIDALSTPITDQPPNTIDGITDPVATPTTPTSSTQEIPTRILRQINRTPRGQPHYTEYRVEYNNGDIAAKWVLKETLEDAPEFYNLRDGFVAKKAGKIINGKEGKGKNRC